MKPQTPQAVSHAPTIDLYNGVCAPKDAQFLVDRLGCSLNRAAFIVKAVNMHEELLKACKYAFDILMRMPEEYAEAISEQTLKGKAIDTAMLEEAIAKAEGK